MQIWVKGIYPRIYKQAPQAFKHTSRYHLRSSFTAWFCLQNIQMIYTCQKSITLLEDYHLSHTTAVMPWINMRGELEMYTLKGGRLRLAKKLKFFFSKVCSMNHPTLQAGCQTFVVHNPDWILSFLLLPHHPKKGSRALLNPSPLYDSQWHETPYIMMAWSCLSADHYVSFGYHGHHA